METYLSEAEELIATFGSGTSWADMNTAVREAIAKKQSRGKKEKLAPAVMPAGIGGLSNLTAPTEDSGEETAAPSLLESDSSDHEWTDALSEAWSSDGDDVDSEYDSFDAHVANGLHLNAYCVVRDAAEAATKVWDNLAEELNSITESSKLAAPSLLPKQADCGVKLESQTAFSTKTTKTGRLRSET